jgi:DNA adenine methylase
LSDLNVELVATFSAVRDEWKRVSSLLQKYQKLHSEAFYYRTRNAEPRSSHTRAAKFIYLNRTCWNGLYRVNTHGHFNVPIGTRQNVVLPTDDFRQISAALQNAALMASDFEPVVHLARGGDFVFADPPYVTTHSENGFLKYNKKLFGWGDQVRLRDALREAKARGAHIFATNANCPIIRDLYENDFAVRTETRPSAIASNASRRGASTELIITSW